MKGLFAKYGLRETVPILATNTAFARSLIGTPVTPALAARSLIFANSVSNGDILIAANEGGNSQAYIWIDGSAGEMRLYGSGTLAAIVTAGVLTFTDDVLLGVGTGSTARFSWDTTDANANALLLQMPAGGAVDVPVLAIGQSIESVDLGLFNGVVDPTIALFGIGAVATGTRLRVYKARGTITSPTVVTTGDDLFSIDAYGAVAAGEYVQAARILFEMTGTIATTRGPGVMTFQTATDAAPSVLNTALTISAAQVIDIPFSLTVGTAGTRTGSVGIDGATSGTVTVTVAAAAETFTLNLTDGVRTNDTQLTNAQVLALRATPITLVAAPGANRAIIVHKVYFYLDAGAGAYTETVDNLVVEYAGGTDITGSIEATGWVAGGARTYGVLDTELTPVANEAVQLFNTGDGEWGGGNAANTLSVRVWYSVVDTVAFT